MFLIEFFVLFVNYVDVGVIDVQVFLGVAN